ncbi:MAG TPA: class I SAM-dependent methyltransferase [Ktedonobacteraceae bacterium]|nr:class I SAM-dependent methyltransferase [Ktedonobacteraceae bacterium]
MTWHVLVFRQDGLNYNMAPLYNKESGGRRESFDLIAEYYNVYRPPYPREVVDTVIALSNLHQGSRVLEIGCGTGQLSVSLAQHGIDLLALEPGPHLAALARQNLKQFPNGQVEISSFEEWPLPGQKFNAVVSASAFHWLDPDVRFSKSAQALHAGGFLTILHIHHVRGGTPGFFADTQPCYVKWGLSDDLSFQPPAPDNTPIMYPELEQQPEFRSVERRYFEIPMSHSTTSYIGWLKTDSLVNSLNDQSRRGFLQDINHLIEAKYNGKVVRNFVYEVIVAQKAL